MLYVMLSLKKQDTNIMPAHTRWTHGEDKTVGKFKQLAIFHVASYSWNFPFLFLFFFLLSYSFVGVAKTQIVGRKKEKT